MNKFKQSIYTVILLLTCFVASPFIYKQIWKNSDIKAKKEEVKAPVVATQQQNQAQQNTSEAATTAPQTNEKGETVTSPTEAAQPATEPQPTEPQVNFVQSGPEYFDDALFIGDSRTEGIRDYGTLKNAQYFCQRGLSAYQIDSTYVNGQTIWDFLNGKNFGKIYIMLGINEVGNDIEYTASAFRKVVDGVRERQPNATIYLLANLHVATYAETSAISNERINALNAHIKDMADNQKSFYIDVNSVFDDANGALTADYCSDGIHVLAKYYATWCEWLCANTVSQTAQPTTTGAAAPTAQQTAVSTAAESAATTLPQNEQFSNQ